MEESFWRPGVVETKPSTLRVVLDERHPDEPKAREKTQLRISTDARFTKVKGNYGWSGGGGFWGEVDRPSKLVALAHTLTFARPRPLAPPLPPLTTASRRAG